MSEIENESLAFSSFRQRGQFVAEGGQVLGGCLDLLDGQDVFGGDSFDALHGFTQLRRRGGLLAGGGRDLRRGSRRVGDGRAERLDRVARFGDDFGGRANRLRAALRGEDGVVRRLLNVAEDAADLSSRFLGLFGERLHFAGDNAEAFAVFARARGFDGGVQREDVGLFGDVVDGGGDLADRLSTFGE